MRRIVLSAVICAVVAGFAAGGATAAPNPSGTGQPGAECGAEGATSEPHGFASGGFSNAESHYAGSPETPSAEHGNRHAVSQYDVACYQVTSNQHGG